MSSSLNYADRTFEQIGAADPNTVVVIPSGAVEVYGPHLPLGSDFIVAEAIARLVTDEIDGLCLPVVPVGYSADLMGYTGTLSVSPEAFKAYMTGICKSLVHWGFRRILFLNTHAGNVGLIDQIADELINNDGCRCLSIDWWRFSGAVGKDLWESTTWAIGHASEQGTSTLKFLRPDLVVEDKAVDFVPDPDPWETGVENYVAFNEVTPTGVLGYASLANEEKGRKLVEMSVRRIVELVDRDLKGDNR